VYDRVRRLRTWRGGGGERQCCQLSLLQDRPAHDALRDAPSCQAAKPWPARTDHIRPTALGSTSPVTMYLHTNSNLNDHGLVADCYLAHCLFNLLCILHN
jgi:hypothetical protein